MFKIDKDKQCIIFFIFSCVALVFFVLSIVSLGGANDADAKYPDAISTSHGSNGKDPGSEKEEEELVEEDEDEEEKSSFENITHVMFFWYYTTAAVFFSIFTIITTLAFLFLFYADEDVDDKTGCFIWCLLIIIPLTVIPAIRMDGFSATTYWVFFMPYLLLALILPVLYLCLLCNEDCLKCSSYHDRSIIVIAPITYLFVLTGLILYILRLDKVLLPSFKYTFIFMFPCIGGAFCVFFMFFENFTDSAIKQIIWSFVAALVVFGGFFLPFLLRKDLIFLTSYHFTLIPYYLLILVLFFGVNVTVCCDSIDND